MAINRAMRAALKAISYVEIDIKKSYKISRSLSKMLARLYIAPDDYTIWDHQVENNGHVVPVRVFSPPKPQEGKVLVFFHGGGWVTGDIDTYSRTCVDLCNNTGHTVIAVDYRLAPEHRFPTALEDCYVVLQEVLAGHLKGSAPQDVTMIGDSAGGNIAAAIALMARDRGEALPARQILIYPATNHDHGAASPFPSIADNGTDFLLTSKRVCEYMELYRSSEEDRRNPYFAPLLAQDFSRQPNTLIITAECCPLRDEGEEYGKRLREAGNWVEIHRVPDALHGFFTLPPQFKHVSEAYTVINQFLREGDPSET